MILKRFFQNRKGNFMLQAIIAIIIAGSAAWIFLHGTDGNSGVVKALGEKWNTQNQILQNDWIR